MTIPDSVLWVLLLYIVVAFYLALELGKTAVRSLKPIRPSAVLMIAFAAALWLPLALMFAGRRFARKIHDEFK